MGRLRSPLLPCSIKPERNFMIKIISGGLDYQSAPLEVNQVCEFDSTTEAMFVQTGKAIFFGEPGSPTTAKAIANALSVADSQTLAKIQSSVSGGVPVTVAMVQANTPPPGGADGYCSISDGDGSIYPRGWRLYWLSTGPYYTLADIKSIDGKVN